MKRTGGVLGDLFLDTASVGMDYAAYKKSNSFTGFLGYRLLYGLMFLLVIASPLILLYIFMHVAKKTPTRPEST